MLVFVLPPVDASESRIPEQFASLKDPSLIRQDAFIDGKWVSPKGDAVIKVTSEYRPCVFAPYSSSTVMVPL